MTTVHPTSEWLMQPERIRYLSPPAAVSMADDWYGIASLDHFWIKRRFEVLCKLADEPIRQAGALADIGCGHGLLQRQVEDHFQRQVSGFDLNEEALKRSMSRTSDVFCYDIFQRSPEYRRHFDVVFLFDVLEHLEQEDEFLDALLFHLAPKGRLLLNVPALQPLWSKYDEAAGHFRRYSIGALSRVAARNGLKVTAWSYWGLPLLPLLILRKWLIANKSHDEIIAAGFDARGAAMNRLLLAGSRCEWTPQHLVGSSLMAVIERS